MYEHLPYSRSELATAMRQAYDEIIDFVTAPEFTAVMLELRALRSPQRPQFVQSVLLSEEELQHRGVAVPEDILIQRSAFGDRRPTLFAVKKFLPEKYRDVWQNVNITFDNAFVDATVSREPDIAWRPPLPVAKQAKMMAAGLDLEDSG